MTAIKKLPLVLMLFIVLVHCKKPIEVPQANVNPEFEMNPPIPSGVWIQQLKEPTKQGNFLITAQFDKAAVKNDYLAMMLSDSLKVVLHDDGLNSDARQGDGIYSLVIQEEEPVVRQQLDDFSKRLKAQKRIYKYEERHAVELDREDLEKRFTFLREIDLTQPLAIDILELPLPDEMEVAALRDRSLMARLVFTQEMAPSPCASGPTGVGQWSLGALLTELVNEPATGINPVDFTMSWLALWQSEAEVNHDMITTRRIQGIIGTWQRFSGGAGQPLLMEKLPFVPVAIVNRLDLRGNTAYGASNAGELRFVFGAVDDECNSLQFTIIMEYGVNKRTCTDIVAYARQWIDLKNETRGSPAYIAKLRQITDQVIRAGTNPDKPNGSSLNQVRTNEVLMGTHWELREFGLSPATHKLELRTVAQTPAEIHNAFNDFSTPLPAAADIARMVDFVNSNTHAIEQNAYTVPEVWQGQPFLGGKARIGARFSYHWDGGTNAGDAAQYIVSDKARHLVSLNTCAGCHHGEGGAIFTHISSRNELSGFVTGLGLDANATDDDNDPAGLFYVADPAGRPAGNPTVRGFNELDRRARDLYALGNGCEQRFVLPEIIRRLRGVPLRMVH
jgi:hypothetical protein